MPGAAVRAIEKLAAFGEAWLRTLCHLQRVFLISFSCTMAFSFECFLRGVFLMGTALHLVSSECQVSAQAPHVDRSGGVDGFTGPILVSRTGNWFRPCI